MNVLWSRYKYPINLIMDVTKAESYEVLVENGFLPFSKEIKDGVEYLIDNCRYKNLLIDHYKNYIPYKELNSEYGCSPESLVGRVKVIREEWLFENNIIFIKYGYKKATEYILFVNESRSKFKQEKEQSVILNVSVDFLDIDKVTKKALRKNEIKNIRQLLIWMKKDTKDIYLVGKRRFEKLKNATCKFLQSEFSTLINLNLQEMINPICIGGTDFGIIKEWYFTKDFQTFYRDKLLTKKLSRKGYEVWIESLEVKDNRQEIYEIKKEIKYVCIRYVKSDDVILSMIKGTGNTIFEALDNCLDNYRKMKQVRALPY